MIPSIEMIPGKYGVGTLLCPMPLDGSGDFNVSRSASNAATRINAQGFIETVADNVPRLDYRQPDGSIGCPALLVEPSAQNALLQSEAFDDPYWTKTGTTSQGNVATSPSNTLTADNIYPTTSGSDQRLQKVISIVSGTTYTSSIFAKANGLNWIRFWSTQLNASAFFDVQSGTIGTVSAGITARIESYGNGWYRCSVTHTATSTGSGQFYINLTNGNNTTLVTASGTNGILFWGAQLETGPIATSYIPTTTAPITRGAEVINKTGVSSLIGQTEGTIYAEVDLRNAISRVASILQLRQDANNQITVGITTAFGGTNTIAVRAQQAGSFVVGFYKPNNAAGIYKIAFAYKSTDCKLYINGTDTGVIIPTNNAFTAFSFNEIQLGMNNLVNQLNDRIRAFAISPTRLTNAQLQELTS